MRPLSVIVPSRNTRALTVECLASVRRSAPPDTELVLVDDDSSDGTAAAVRERMPEVEVVVAPSRLGFTRAANLGLERASGRILLLLNSDTIIEPASLDALVSAFEREPDLGAVGGQLVYPDGAPQWSGGDEPSLLWFFALASGLPRLLARVPGYRKARPLERTAVVRVDWVTGACLGLRRSAVDAAGLLDERFAFYGQDLDYCCRLRHSGWRVAIDPRVRVVHHHGATIRQQSGTSAEGKHLALLWVDLLRWAQKHHRAGWVRLAEAALWTGGSMRLVGHTILRPLIPPRRRHAWREDSAALRSALATSKEWARSSRPSASF